MVFMACPKILREGIHAKTASRITVCKVQVNVDENEKGRLLYNTGQHIYREQKEYLNMI
jgi:hypothetical protein